ncbi:MAG: GtrA family protein [Ruminococcus sp.]|nr:GtrA family protein [Ruminococcus sp.]MBR4622795.1 GtrA family protein [Ruminococcus sp.]
MSQQKKRKTFLEMLRFSASSAASFILDYGLFCLFGSAFGFSAAAANITARVCSSVFNFTVNRRLVFGTRTPLLRSAAGYFSLAAVVLALNTLLLEGFILLGLSRYLAKPLTEVLLFALSWAVQHFVVFRPGEKNAN